MANPLVLYKLKSILEEQMYLIVRGRNEDLTEDIYESVHLDYEQIEILINGLNANGLDIVEL